MGDKNPERLEIRIFCGENAIPVIDDIKADVDDKFKKYDELTQEDKLILLARPQIAWLTNRNRANMQDIKYKKHRESGEPPHDMRRKGAFINVAYVLDKDISN